MTASRRRHPIVRLLLRPIVVAATLLALLGIALNAGAPSTLAQPAPSFLGTADVVVDFDDGRVAVHRIAFDEGLTGEALLRDGAANGLTSDWNGAAVCRIGGVGCPTANCFCGPYWAYHWRADDGAWAYATTGAAARTLRAGDVDGWVWRGARAPITATAQQRAVWLGARWLGAQQLPGGDYPSPGLAVEAILAARAAGVDPHDWTRDGRSVVDALVDAVVDYSEPSAAQAGKGLVGLAAAGVGLDEPALLDPAGRLARFYDPATGRYGLSTWEQAWAILGTAAATNGAPGGVPRAAVDALVAGAAPGGGWSSMLGEPEAEIDATGLAVQALVAAGEPITSTAIAAALAYLDAGQRDDGGWGHDGHHATTNANSTAYALQALYAAGEDPTAPRWTSPTGRTGVDHLLGLQRPDGAVAFDAADTGNALVASGQAIPALSGRALAVRSPRLAADRAAAALASRRSADGSFDAGAANPGATIDAVLALAAHGRWRDRPAAPSATTVAAYLGAIARDYAARGPSAAGKLLAAIGALRAASDDPAALDPHAFGGVDVVAALEARYDPATGAYGDGGTWSQSWAILGLSAVDVDVPVKAVDALRSATSPAGGWGFEARAAAPDVDSTGLALEALGAVGLNADDAAVAAGIAVLRRTQNATGGWPGFGPPDGASVDTTAAAVLGLAAVGQHVDRTGWYRPSPAHPLGRGPLDALAAAPSPSGAFPGFGGPDDVVATAAALRALVARVAAPAARPAAAYIPFALRQRR